MGETVDQGDGDDDNDLYLSPEQQLQKLKQRVGELKATIKAVEYNLREGGYNIQEVQLEKKDVAPKSGIRINNKLTARGEMMSREMFDRFPFAFHWILKRYWIELCWMFTGCSIDVR